MRLLRLLKNDLAREAAEWVKQGIIRTDQAEKICELYNADYHQRRKQSIGYAVLVSLGYLFIALAVITLIGANWNEIPRALRMTGLIALTMATQGMAIHQYSSGKRNSAIGLFFLGNFFYGISIVLIAQIYHLGEHMPDGVFWWALGCLPIALLVNSSWLILQPLVLAVIWASLEVSMGFYPALFPLFIAGALLTLWRGQASVLLFLAVVASTGFWTEFSLAWFWNDGPGFSYGAEHIVVSTALFLFAHTLSQWLSQQGSASAKDYGAVLAVWTLRFALVFLLVMSFEEPWREFLTADWNHVPSMLVVSLLIAAAALWLSYLGQALSTLGCWLFLSAGALVAVLLSGTAEHAPYFQTADNLVLIAFGTWLILQGIRKGISHYFFLGVATILMTGFLRYINLIGDYVGGALLFMFFAALLLGAAQYWKRYRVSEDSL